MISADQAVRVIVAGPLPGRLGGIDRIDWSRSLSTVTRVMMVATALGATGVCLGAGRTTMREMTRTVRAHMPNVCSWPAQGWKPISQKQDKADQTVSQITNTRARNRTCEL